MTYISFCQTVSVVIQANLRVVAAALIGTGQWGDVNVKQRICFSLFAGLELTAK